VEQITTFVLDNLLLFGALAVVLVMLIKAEFDHQLNKGLLVSPSNAIRLMNNHEDMLLLDTRSSGEFNAGHIKGAKNVPVSEFAGKVSSLESYKNRPVLVYCNTGNTATRAIKILKAQGFSNIKHLEGGIMAWKDANLPITKK
jgi:rhodanese-related sulfurtransferase